jgi:hypothetical protein
LNHGPFGVVGEVPAFSDVVHHALAKLGRVKVASRSIIAGASGTAVARITGTAEVVILAAQIPAGQAEGGGQPQYSNGCFKLHGFFSSHHVSILL